MEEKTRRKQMIAIIMLLAAIFLAAYFWNKENKE